MKNRIFAPSSYMYSINDIYIQITTRKDATPSQLWKTHLKEAYLAFFYMSFKNPAFKMLLILSLLLHFIGIASICTFHPFLPCFGLTFEHSNLINK